MRQQQALTTNSKVDSPLTILGLLSVEEIERFDPQHLIIKSFIPNDVIESVEPLPEYHNFKGNLCFTVEQLNQNVEFLNIIKDILIEDPFSFLNQPVEGKPRDKVLFSHDFIKDKLDRAAKLFDGSALNLNGAEYLICQMSALRLYKEIKYQNIPFPYAVYTSESCAKDFEKLKAKLIRMKKNKSTLADKKSLPISVLGRTVSDSEMQTHRSRVKNKNEDFSMAELWERPELISRLSGEMRVRIGKCRKGSYKTFQISMDFLRKQLYGHGGVSQYAPIIVGQMIINAKEQQNRPVESLLDLAAGWGDRLVGAMAAASIGLKYYTATDPNQLLHPGYQEIITSYKPDGFTAHIHNKPMEDLTLNELMPHNKRHDMMLTCPPYFDVEDYQGANQSFRRYSTYENWRDNFLYRLFTQTMQCLHLNGTIALHTGKAGKHDIPGDVRKYVAQCPMLTLQASFGSSISGSEMVFVKFIGDQSGPQHWLPEPVTVNQSEPIVIDEVDELAEVAVEEEPISPADILCSMKRRKDNRAYGFFSNSPELDKPVEYVPDYAPAI